MAKAGFWKKFFAGEGFVATAAAIIAVIALPVAYFEGQTARQLADKGLQTEGRILSAAAEPQFKDGKRTWVLRETWAFTTEAGERIEGSTVTPTGTNMPVATTPGRVFQVTYLPENPRIYDLGVGESSETARTAFWLGVLCVLAALGFGVRGVLKARRG